MKRKALSGKAVLFVLFISVVVALVEQATGAGGRIPLFSTTDGVLLAGGIIAFIVVTLIVLIKRNS
jgi:hypothetical protein